MSWGQGRTPTTPREAEPQTTLLSSYPQRSTDPRVPPQSLTRLAGELSGAGGGAPRYAGCVYSGPACLRQQPYHWVLRLGWAGQPDLRRPGSHCPVGQKREGSPSRAGKRLLAAHNEDTRSPVAGSPGPGTGPRPASQVRPGPWHCVPRTVSSRGSSRLSA